LTKTLLFSIIFMIISGFLNKSDKDLNGDNLNPPFLCCESPWADSVFNAMSPEERMGQLFMVAAYSDKGPAHIEKIEDLIKNQKIGGLIFFKGGPMRQAILTNRYQELSKTPLMIAIDAEWGLAMRLDSTIKYPYQMMLGAITDNDLIYQMGADIARQCKRMGIHVNFAPVVDVNNNPKNPVINYRSFGEDRDNVAEKGIAYMKGMQDNRVLANAKHFPGHGDTDTDSHKSLPVIAHSKERLDSLELYPFKKMIKQGLGSMMIAHLYIPAYEQKKNTASTLSKNIVKGLLRDSLGFQGLIFTDALNMQGVSKYFKPGIVDVKALLAGNDILLFPQDVPTAIREIKKAIKKGGITQAEIDTRCKRILKAKEWLQLDDNQSINYDNLYNDLNLRSEALLQRKLVESGLTLVANKSDIIPFKHLDKLNIATVSIGSNYGKVTTFQSMLGNYAPMDHYFIGNRATDNQIADIIEKLGAYNLVITSLHSNTNRPSKNFGIKRKSSEIINSILKKTKVVLVGFSNPYGLSQIENLNNLEALLVSYNNNELTQELSAQLLFGGISAKGKLPVTINKEFTSGMGVVTGPPSRLKYVLPEEVGIKSSMLDTIDSIAEFAIREEATPGCQVFIAKNGKIFYQKSFGYHTYDKKLPVTNDDLYDIASVTKIAATISSLMKLQEEGKISIDSTLGYYIAGIDTSEKSQIVIRELLAHQSGLKSWIPFWMETMENVKYNARKKKYITKRAKYVDNIYAKTPSDFFPTKVAENLYINKNYTDSIMYQLLASPLREEKEYHYSDLGYYFLLQIIEDITGEPLEEYTARNFYTPLGLTKLGFLPKDRFNVQRMIPTEDDKVYRRQLIQGDVHDPRAAMLGGVGGLKCS